MNLFQSMLVNSEASVKAQFPVLAGNSVVAHALRQMVQLAATVDQPTFLTGPGGSGKAAVAHAIHALSPYADDQFSAYDCAAITLRDQRLSLSKGRDWPGSAFRGTVFLDEIGSMPLSLQRALPEWIIETSQSPTTIRLIVGSSLTSAELIRKRAIEPELLILLDRMTIPMQPLSRRRGDIMALLTAIWANDHLTLPPTLGATARHLVEQHDWPGNFNELQMAAKVLARVYGGRRIGAEHIRQLITGGTLGHAWKVMRAPVPAEPGPPGLDLRGHLAREEAAILMAALERSDWIVGKAADLAGVNRTSFLQKMRRHGIRVRL